MTVLTLVEGFYEEVVFRGGDPCGICKAARVQSQVLEALDLTAEQILSAEID